MENLLSDKNQDSGEKGLGADAPDSSDRKTDSVELATSSQEVAEKKQPDVPPEEWAQEFGTYLLRVANTSLNNQAIAEELVQDTFISAIKALDNFEGRSSVKTWLRTILRNKIIDYFRRAKRAEFVSLPDSSFEEGEEFFNKIGIWKDFLQSWGPTPEDMLQGQQFYGVLQDCLSKLPIRHRNIFMSRMLEGMEKEDICKDYGISASNYWVIMHRARLLLRKCIDKNWMSQNV